MRHLTPARCAGAVTAALVAALATTPHGARAAGPSLGLSGDGGSTAKNADRRTAPLPVRDPRIREIRYDPNAVVTLPVKRGVVTHLLLAPDEAITDVATGLGADCSRAEASWCIAAQSGGHQIFIKPKSTASGPNTLAIATDKRVHTLRLVLLGDGDRREPLYRLQILPPRPAAPDPSRSSSATGHLQTPQWLPDLTPLAEPDGGDDATPAIGTGSAGNTPSLEDRLNLPPQVRNARYSLSEGKASQDIVPTAVWDDGRFTYLRFPNNREVPAVFHVLPDGSETVVNARMEGDLLAIDRVSRHLVLRAGSAVIGVWNDAFDLDGVPARGGTTVSGVRRILKPIPSASPVPLDGAQ